MATFTVTNCTTTRTLDLAEASLDQLADLIGTVITDTQAGTYDGATYTITNSSTDKTYDADATSLDELLNVIGTAISDNSGDAFVTDGYTLDNYTLDFVLDCTSTSLNELADVLATLLRYWRVLLVPTLCTVQFRVNLSATPVSGAVCKARLVGVNQASVATILSNEESSDTTDALGEAELSLVQENSFVKGSGIYTIEVESGGKPVANKQTTIPSQNTVFFADLL